MHLSSIHTISFWHECNNSFNSFTRIYGQRFSQRFFWEIFAVWCVVCKDLKSYYWPAQYNKSIEWPKVISHHYLTLIHILFRAAAALAMSWLTDYLSVKKLDLAEAIGAIWHLMIQLIWRYNGKTNVISVWWPAAEVNNFKGRKLRAFLLLLSSTNGIANKEFFI